jgi:hypothetical protein
MKLDHHPVKRHTRKQRQRIVALAHFRRGTDALHQACANVDKGVQQQTTKQDDACLVAIGQQVRTAQAITPSASGNRKACRKPAAEQKNREAAAWR